MSRSVTDISCYAGIIAVSLLRAYEIVWEVEDRWETDGNDLLIAACAIEHKLPLVAHDRIVQKIEVIFPDVFRRYTLLDDLNPISIRGAESRLRLVEHISVP